MHMHMPHAHAHAAHSLTHSPATPSGNHNIRILHVIVGNVEIVLLDNSAILGRSGKDYFSREAIVSLARELGGRDHVGGKDQVPIHQVEVTIVKLVPTLGLSGGLMNQEVSLGAEIPSALPKG